MAHRHHHRHYLATPSPGLDVQHPALQSVSLSKNGVRLGLRYPQRLKTFDVVPGEPHSLPFTTTFSRGQNKVSQMSAADGLILASSSANTGLYGL